MLIRKNSVLSFLILLFLFTPIYAGAVNFNQTITLKADGSGSVVIFYLEKESLVKDNLIGNLPFSKEKIEQFFSSAKIKIFESSVSKSEKDNTLTQVTVSLMFSSLNDLSDLKGLTGEKFEYTKTDTGMVLRNSFSPDFIKSNSINQIYCVLKTDENIRSTNGTIKDKTISWFRSKEFLNTPNSLNFVATLGSSKEIATKNGNEGSGNEKSCGLFGLELPFLMLFGLIYTMSIRKTKI